MNAIRKALAVMVKDLRVVSKDRAYLISMLIFPLLVSFLNASMNPAGTGIHLPVAMANQDAGGYGASIVQVLENIGELELAKVDSPDAAEESIAAGEYLAAVVIPADFSQKIGDYQQAEITVILDPAQASYGRILTGIVEELASAVAIQGEIRYGIRTVLAEMNISEQSGPDLARAAQAQVEGVIFTQMQRMETDATIQVKKDVLQGRQVFTWDNLFALMMPALAAMFAFFITAAVSTDMHRERDGGALRRLIASPLPRGSLVGGKVLAYTLIVVIQMIILFGTGVIIMDMPLGSSPLGLVVTTLCLGLVATTLGMMVAALARTVEQAGTISILIIFVLGFLSGSFSPQIAFYRGEGLMAFISRYTPQAQATIAYHTLVLQGGGMLDILPQVVYLLVLSLIFFGVAVWRFKFE